jgi:ectoine hydroxylase-related dioxygenase (phytanoyl-CoA dioxygenase family)
MSFHVAIVTTCIYDPKQAMIDPQKSVLGRLLQSCLQGQTGVFHELSALIVDPHAASQPIHPDAPYTPLPPLWTIFVALQDISSDMGPTVFLPGTNQENVHRRLNEPDAKEGMLVSREYRQSVLQKGDVAVMDARTMHFGSANTSEKRRVLLYCSIRNPAHGGNDSDFPGCGSLFADLQGLTTRDFY